MDLGRVIGTVTATQKDRSLEGVQLCVVQPVDESLKAAGEPLVASEASRSRSVGDVVFIVSSGDAVYTHPDGRAMPVDAAIVGLVDRVSFGSAAGSGAGR
jgi:ethanolamine utilization protein EutN